MTLKFGAADGGGEFVGSDGYYAGHVDKMSRWHYPFHRHRPVRLAPKLVLLDCGFPGTCSRSMIGSIPIGKDNGFAEISG